MANSDIMWNEKKDQGKKGRKNRTSGRVRVEFITKKHPISGFVHYGSERINVICYLLSSIFHKTQEWISNFVTFPNPIVLKLVTRVIESFTSLSYCKRCLIAVLPSKRMAFKPTHINFRVHVISYLTRLYMTQSHFSSVHQTT